MTSGLPSFSKCTPTFSPFCGSGHFKSKLNYFYVGRFYIHFYLYIYSSLLCLSLQSPSMPSLAGHTLHLTDAAASAWRWQPCSKDSQAHPHFAASPGQHNKSISLARGVRGSISPRGGGGGPGAGGGRVRDLAYLIIMKRAFSCSAAMTAMLTLTMIILIRIRLMGQPIPCQTGRTHRWLRETSPCSASACPFRSE